MYPKDSHGLAIVPADAVNSLPEGIEAIDLPVRQGNVVTQTVKANGRLALRELNLTTGDNVLRYLD
jgi:hypothetical protein